MSAAESTESPPLPPPGSTLAMLLAKLSGVKPSPETGRWLCECPLPDHDGDRVPAVVWLGEDGAVEFECNGGCESHELSEWFYPKSPAPTGPLGEEPPPAEEGAHQAIRSTIRRIALAEVEAPPVESFVVGNLFPFSKPSVVWGPSGAGKSTFLSQLAFKVAAGGGGTFLGMQMHDQDGAPVLVYSAEDNYDDWVRKAAAVRHGYRDIDIARAIKRLAVVDKSEGEARFTELVQTRIDLGGGSSVTRHERRPTEERRWLIEQAKKQGARLIIVETASRLVEEETNENMTALLSACGDVAAQSGAAVVVSHHPTKAAAADNDSRPESARGGGSFVNNSRCAVSLFPADARTLAQMKEQRGLDFAEGDVLMLEQKKGTSSVRAQKPIIVVRCSTPFGGVLQLPELIDQDPQQAAELARRAARQQQHQAERLADLFDKVAELKPLGPGSKNKLRSYHKDFGVSGKHEDVDAFVDRAIAAGVLLIARKDSAGKVLSLDLGVRPATRERQASRDRFAEDD